MRLSFLNYPFLFIFFIGSILSTGSFAQINSVTSGEQLLTELKISTFDIDATPPVGSYLAYDKMENSGELGLRARGLVLLGNGKPVVLCAVDWLGIANEGQDAFKKALAEAADTDIDRVVVHTLHQHDAPVCDFSAERILKRNGIKPQSFKSDFQRKFIKRLKAVVENSVKTPRPVTHYSIGAAPVYKVASNRRIMDENGRMMPMRGSSCKDSLLQAKPEGIIDSMVSVIGLWNGDTPVAVLSFYATHPQSYYLTRVANPDFPGIARFFRQLEVPDALHVHFNGAGGNIAAGKYNDGSHETRAVLAARLADGMKRAWELGKPVEINVSEVGWFTEAVSLQPAKGVKEQIELEMKTGNMRYLTNNIQKLAWIKRAEKGQQINISCLKLGNARILFMPGKPFVEYQLAAKAMHPELFVAMAAYGDYGPFYIGTREAYKQGGYEIEVSPVTCDAEEVLITAMKKLLAH